MNFFQRLELVLIFWYLNIRKLPISPRSRTFMLSMPAPSVIPWVTISLFSLILAFKYVHCDYQIWNWILQIYLLTPSIRAKGPPGLAEKIIFFWEVQTSHRPAPCRSHRVLIRKVNLYHGNLIWETPFHFERDLNFLIINWTPLTSVLISASGVSHKKCEYQ